MNMSSAAQAKLSEVQRLSDKRNTLLNELGVSLEVQAIWPEAFEGGQRCRLRAQETGDTWQNARNWHKSPGLYKRPEITSAYLQRDDGVCFPLTSDQFYQLAKEFRP